MVFETRLDDQFWLMPSIWRQRFAMLACATNPLWCLVFGPSLGGAADRYFSALQLQLDGRLDPARLLPASPWQGFLLGYVCGILWFAGTCYWIFDTMHRYGEMPIPAAALALLLFCMYVGLYHGMFGLLLALVVGYTPKHAGSGASIRRGLVAVPFLWVAVELARTRITGFPWELLGYSQTGNSALTRIATLVGVYGLSFEIVLVNSVFAAAFLAPKERRKWLLAAAFAGALILQAGQLLAPPAIVTDHTALLVQPSIPILEGSMWTTGYFQGALRDLTALSLHRAGEKADQHYDLIVWPESPAPFYTNDPLFRDAMSALARQSGTWVVTGAIGINPAMTMEGQSNGQNSQIFNSAGVVNPQGEWVGRYDKVHLVPFGEYLPFPSLFAFAGGLTKEVGEFQPGVSHAPLDTSGATHPARLGTFICYESIFPDEVRQGPLAGAQVLLNISNDGWYGDSGAWAQHLQQTRMRAIENDRWLLSDANTGKTASIDPYGRIVATIPRKVRTTLAAPYGLISGTTFYTRHGDWFAYLCAIISVGALVARFVLPERSA
jgi:apolipoprotein N-acyltransferase